MRDTIGIIFFFFRKECAWSGLLHFFFFNKLAAITSRKVTDRKNALNESVGLVAFFK